MNLTVSSLHIYPLKSAQGISVTSMQLGKLGPDLDRRWMLIDINGKFITQRKHPKMCFICTELIGNKLVLKVPEADSIEVARPNATRLNSKVWGSLVSGNDCGDEIADYLSKFLGTKCRLIFMPENFERQVDTGFANNNELVGFADGFPLLVTSQASLNDFNHKLAYPIEMERFRPNLVINGNKAYDEDKWQRISINNITLSLVKPCARCIMPSINPATGEKEIQVNQTLMQYRRQGRNTYFGQNSLYDRFGIINVGDQVKVLESQS